VQGQIEMTVEVEAVSCAEGNLFSGFVLLMGCGQIRGICPPEEK
jgi:hypothetical protein